MNEHPDMTVAEHAEFHKGKTVGELAAYEEDETAPIAVDDTTWGELVEDLGDITWAELEERPGVGPFGEPIDQTESNTR